LFRRQETAMIDPELERAHLEPPKKRNKRANNQRILHTQRTQSRTRDL
jgi:hypothetical protein